MIAEDFTDVLIHKKVVSIDLARMARERAASSGGTSLQHLVSSGQLNENALLDVVINHFSIPMVKLASINVQALELVPLEMIVQFKCLPFQIDPDQTLRVAIADPANLIHIDALKAKTGRMVIPLFTTFSILDGAINRVIEIARTTISTAAKEAAKEKAKESTRETPAAASAEIRKKVPAPEKSLSEKKPIEKSPPPPPSLQRVNRARQDIRKFKPTDQVVQILNQVLIEAVQKGASDVHFDPQLTHMTVRFRFEGVLFDVFEVPLELKDQLSNRVKVTAGLDISERRLPQDGRAKLKVGDGDINFRTSVMPSLYGESIVFRILKQSDLQLDIAKVGFNPQQLAAFKRGIGSPNGMLLVTGPTGSGKTTTLYSALSALNERSVKITTVEDPVEYNLGGITQVQVNKDTGLDFAEVLKSTLRQDPDIILVGEIRDQETAAIAVQAALTGHLVFSSLHTNDAASAVVRLLNMKVEPFAVLASINMVLAQRLIRKICPSCAEPAKVTEEQLQWLGNDRKIVENCQHSRGKGCDACFGGGYRGRVAIFEILELDDVLKEMFLRGENIINIKRHALANGMTTLRQSALALVAAGQTTLAEAVALTLEN